MAAFIDIYPTSNYTYYGRGEFSTARNDINGIGADALDTLESNTYISAGPLDWKIYRSYIKFDLSGVPGNIVQLDFNAAKSTNGTNPSLFLVYGGSGSLVGDLSEYSLYVDKVVYDPITSEPISLYGPWDLPSPFPDYYSVVLNTTDYPINPPYTNFIVGLVTRGDLYSSAEERYNPTLLGRTSSYPPYLRVHYFPTGYANIVMGVTGANISTVSGVPSANISKVMGV